ncbi:TRAP transporter small permease [Chachezhania sediminis]|uniref:TRAP transporter small permease n=1 Tax=Chachezhania sediminis TaxID=2599291 RepID=UPI00131E4BFA|nr:TRAP transporter small permease [Chachezhania sediminis]
MRLILTSADTAIRWLCYAALAIAAVFIALMAVIGTADVIGTSVLGRPVPSALEISEVALVIVVFTGLAAAQMKGSHITVDILSGRFTGWLRRLSMICSRLAAMAFFGAIAWFGMAEALHSWQIDEHASGATPIALYPGKFLLALGCAVATLEAFRQLLHILAGSEPTISAHDAGGMA